MSKGYGGAARLVLQDDETVIYEYFADNVNHPEYYNKNCIYDGIITISKSALIEPEIQYYSDLIQVQNSHFCWQILDNGWGIAATRIIWKIFDKYQKTGTLPEIIGWMC